jgi:hypothetical protein
MLEPVTAADCRLLLSLLKFAIVAPDQRERVQAWLEAKHDGLDPGSEWKRRQAASRGERGYQAYEPGEIEPYAIPYGARHP